jgi:Protein of Unknown function (DUF2784)
MVNAYTALEAAVLALHLLWIAWILLGWLFTRGRPELTAIHLASLLWGVAVELGPWPCPLTIAEEWLASRSGATPYQQSFLVHYLDKLIYPGFPEAVVGWSGAGVCLAIAGIYVKRFWRERPNCHAAPRRGDAR